MENIKEIRKFVNNWLWVSTERNTVEKGWGEDYLNDCALMIKDYVNKLEKRFATKIKEDKSEI